MKIEVWSDVVCPWCFIGKRRLEGALAEFEHRDDVEIVYRSCELDPNAPTENPGPVLAAIALKYGATEVKVLQQQQQTTATAAVEDLDFQLDGQPHSNTFAAHRLLHFALETDVNELHGLLKETLLHAHFEKTQDVGDHVALAEVAAEVGLDRSRVEEVLNSDKYTAEGKADVEEAR